MWITYYMMVSMFTFTNAGRSKYSFLTHTPLCMAAADCLGDSSTYCSPKGVCLDRAGRGMSCLQSLQESCMSGLVCDASSTCILAPTPVSIFLPCTSSTECLGATLCTEKYGCLAIDVFAGQCLNDNWCPNDSVCNSATLLCDRYVSSQCLNDRECGSHYTCNEGNCVHEVCYPAWQGTECTDAGECWRGWCFPPSIICAQGDTCQGRLCSSKSGTCVSPECMFSNTECGDDASAWNCTVDYRCVPLPVSGATCTFFGGACNELSETCTESYGCQPLIDVFHGQCLTDRWCASGQICNAATMQCQVSGSVDFMCESSDQCGQNYICDVKQCVSESCSQFLPCVGSDICWRNRCFPNPNYCGSNTDCKGRFCINNVCINPCSNATMPYIMNMQITTGIATVVRDPCLSTQFCDKDRICKSCPVGRFGSEGGGLFFGCTECPVGTFSNVLASTECTVCAVGKVTDIEGSSLCTACEVGKYTDTVGNSMCTACAKGNFTDIDGSAICKQCIIGKFTDKEASTTCRACEVGKFSSTLESSECITCAKGTFTKAVGRSVCTACDPGTFSESMGSSVCMLCAKGTFTDINGHSICKQCVVGKFTDTVGSTTCRACEVGKFSSTLQSSECTACAKGTFAEAVGSSVCTACDPGRFVESVRSSVCMLCAKGTFTDTNGNSICKQCVVGKFTDIVGSTTCRACEVGKFSSTLESSECTACAKGTFAEAVGRSVCMFCAKGNFTENDGSEICKRCVLGTFTNTLGSTTCEACEIGTISNNLGSSVCTACEVGKFSDTLESSVCTACAKGTFSESVGKSMCMLCAEGKFTDIEGSAICEQCVTGTFTNILASTTCEVCEAGKFSNTLASSVCTTCESGKSSTSGSSECSDDCLTCDIKQVCSTDKMCLNIDVCFEEVCWSPFFCLMDDWCPTKSKCERSRCTKVNCSSSTECGDGFSCNDSSCGVIKCDPTCPTSYECYKSVCYPAPKACSTSKDCRGRVCSDSTCTNPEPIESRGTVF
jgi:hypothetical protein